MVGAADCRSAGPWFNSGWKSWFTFLTGYDKLTNQIIQMFNNTSPTRTVITTITRKSVNMVAELDNDTAPSRIFEPAVSVWRTTLQWPRLLRRLQWRWTQRPVQHREQLFNWRVNSSNLNSPGQKPRLKQILSQWSHSSHRANSETTPWCTECQDDLSESRWTGSGTLHSVLPCRLKSNTFDLTMRTSWSPTPHIWRWRKTLSQKIQQHSKTQCKIAWFARQKSRKSRSTPTRVCLRNWRSLHLVLILRCTTRSLTATILSRRSRVWSVTWSRGWKRKRPQMLPQGVWSQAHFQPYVFRDRNDALHDHVTARGSVPDDLDEFFRFMHHEIESRSVLCIMQMARGDKYSRLSRKQHHQWQGDVEPVQDEFWRVLVTADRRRFGWVRRSTGDQAGDRRY